MDPKTTFAVPLAGIFGWESCLWTKMNCSASVCTQLVLDDTAAWSRGPQLKFTFYLFPEK